MLWTIELDDEVLKLAEQGLSYSRIADTLNKQLGISITRSAISGRVNREKFLPRKEKKSTRPAPLPPKPMITKPKSPYFNPKITASLCRSNIPVMGKPRLIPIYELEHNECHWPVDESEEGVHLFCGQATVEHHSYCRHHTREAMPEWRWPENRGRR